MIDQNINNYSIFINQSEWLIESVGKLRCFREKHIMISNYYHKLDHLENQFYNFYSDNRYIGKIKDPYLRWKNVLFHVYFMLVEDIERFWATGSLLLGSLLPVILEGHVWASIEGERVLWRNDTQTSLWRCLWFDRIQDRWENHGQNTVNFEKMLSL